MIFTAVMATLSTAAVAFYVRFLVAMCKDCKPALIGYWVRLRPHARLVRLVELQGQSDAANRVA